MNPLKYLTRLLSKKAKTFTDNQDNPKVEKDTYWELNGEITAEGGTIMIAVLPNLHFTYQHSHFNELSSKEFGMQLEWLVFRAWWLYTIDHRPITPTNKNQQLPF